jgi:hypothetical protein
MYYKYIRCHHIEMPQIEIQMFEEALHMNNTLLFRNNLWSQLEQVQVPIHKSTVKIVS